jgi:activating signal cointegrator 1
LKALSLTQPWATLVAVGAKQIETRSWKTKWRGPLAIHAAKVMPGYAKDFLRDTVGRYLFVSQDFETPRGVIVAKAFLVGCVPTKTLGRDMQILNFQHHVPLAQELLFGNYEEGRWAWLLRDVQRVDPPVPAIGHQGLWEWKE